MRTYRFELLEIDPHPAGGHWVLSESREGEERLLIRAGDKAWLCPDTLVPICPTRRTYLEQAWEKIGGSRSRGRRKDAEIAARRKEAQRKERLDGYRRLYGGTKPPAKEKQIKAEKAPSQPHCPWCYEGIDPGDDTITCSKCDAVNARNCAVEFGGKCGVCKEKLDYKLAKKAVALRTVELPARTQKPDSWIVRFLLWLFVLIGGTVT